MSSTAIALIGVFVLGWLLASIFGTWAYFANEPQDRQVSADSDLGIFYFCPNQTLEGLKLDK